MSPDTNWPFYVFVRLCLPREAGVEASDHFVTFRQIEYAPDVMSGAYFVPRMLARPAGFEPATLGSEDQCSIH